MGHIFTSYSSQHRDLTEKLAELLVSEGYTVWWDHALESWGSYQKRATRPEHGSEAAARACGLIDHIVRTHAATLAADILAVGTETAGALLGRIETAVPSLDEPALAALDDALPLQSLALMDVSLAVAEKRAGLARKLPADTEAAPTPTLKERLSLFLSRRSSPGSVQQTAALSHAAARLGTLGIRLSDLGRREEALAASQEAVDIGRRLAKDRPDAFLPDLARSIGVMSDVLAAMSRHAEAAAAAQEALAILVPYVERYPDTYGSLARTIESDVLRYSEAAAVEPDGQLLQRVMRALGGKQE